MIRIWPPLTRSSGCITRILTGFGKCGWIVAPQHHESYVGILADRRVTSRSSDATGALVNYANGGRSQSDGDPLLDYSYADASCPVPFKVAAPGPGGPSTFAPGGPVGPGKPGGPSIPVPSRGMRHSNDYSSTRTCRRDTLSSTTSGIKVARSSRANSRYATPLLPYREAIDRVKPPSNATVKSVGPECHTYS